MSQIVYYDANPTVRLLMARMFGQYGLEVIIVPALEKCEEVFKSCSHPVAFIADMSRQPDFLPTLQNIVPRFIRDPERCILTSIRPPALAQYLPECVDNCFFKHVVERPFKRIDFMHFFEDIIKPYLASSKSLVLEHIKSCVNSSVEQITGPFQAPHLDEGFEIQVEGIVESTSNAIPINQLVEDAASSPSNANNDDSVSASYVQRCNNRMSRRSRAVSRDSQPRIPENLNPVESSHPRVREQVRNVRESSCSRRENSNPSIDSYPRQIPVGRTRPVVAPSSGEIAQNVPLANESNREIKSPSDSGLGVKSAVPPCPPKFVPSNPYMRKLDESKDPTVPTKAPSPEELKCIEASMANEEDEDESTMIVPPAIANVAIDPSVSSPSLVVQNGDCFIQSVLEISWLKSILKMSLIREQRYTAVCKNRNETLVIFMNKGRVDWLEKVNDSMIPQASEFLVTVPPSENLPMAEILSQLNSSATLTDVFISLGLEKQIVNICRRTIHMNMMHLASFDGKPVEVYHDVPARWLSLIKQRPIYSIDIIPFLFDELRENSDSLIVPQYFQTSRFAMRPWRTPQNVGIELIPAESEILCMMQNPVSIADLRRSGRKGVAEIVYRLALFELVDFVQ